MKAMRPGSAERVPVTSSDELGLLSENFNRMSEELATTYLELEKSRQRLEELSLEDDLTALFNRRAFDQLASITLRQAKRNERSECLAMIDIDHFKRVNDDFSHLAGDAVLRHLGQILKINLRESDVIARYGGEEFVVLLPATEIGKALKLMERVRLVVADTNWIDIDEQLRVTMSIGLVEINPETGYDLETALRIADERLYKAKKSGGNRTAY